MPLSLTELEAQRDVLLEQASVAEKRVEYDGMSVERRPMHEIRRALADVERRIAAAQNQKPVTDIRFTHSKGL